MTLIRDLINIPEHVQDGDFVLKLTEGVEPDHARATVEQYVVTPQLAAAFDEALTLIASSVKDGNSRAAYLHGSFGSGKSHFMAILHLLLQGNVDARGISDLHGALDKSDEVLAGKRFLLVPLHFLTAKSMDATILGGYVKHVAETDPASKLPAVFLADEIIKKELPHQRELVGEERFIQELNRAAGSNEAWGDYGSEWTTQGVDEALQQADAKRRSELAAAYIAAFRQGTVVEALNVGDGFINLDDGLAAVSQHAADLGYDGVILFLDELILWLAANIGDLDFVQAESQKLTKLVEANNPNRPVPVISFVARQRDLRELVGDHIAGSELRSFSDNLELMKGRFATITLEDRNLPTIASKRVLKPVDSAAAEQLAGAVDGALQNRDDIRQRLLTSDADLELFRTVYPFSPAAIQTLIAVSEALQRERTALKVMLQLLVDGRDSLELGDLIPVGDLWDVVADRDEPFSAELKHAFETAKSIYRTKLRPMLLNQHELTEETAPDDPRWQGFRNDDRIVKTILLAALVAEVEVFRNLDAAKLVALNWGSVTSPVPGRETTVLTQKLRTWNSFVGELKVGDDPVNPSVSIALVDVDTDAIIERAIESFDNEGQRRQVLRALVDEDLGNRVGADLFSTVEIDWRGTRRSVHILFGNIRDTAELSDSQLRSTGDTPKIVIDFPFDAGGHTPEDDLQRLDAFAAEEQPTTSVCWIPSFFNTQGLSALRTYVAISELLKGNRYDQHTQHLSPTQRQEARPILQSRRDQLRDQLKRAIRCAYGVVGGGNPLLDQANTLTDHFRSLDPALVVRPTTEPTLEGAFDQLCAQMFAAQYPGHPEFESRITSAQLRTTWSEIGRALGDPDGRVTVENKNRSAVRTVANPLELGVMHESHFILGRQWKDRLDRHLEAARTQDRQVTVADMRAWIDDPSGARRGLPNHIADLVVLTVAAQTDRVVELHGSVVAADGGTALPAEAVLVLQALPDEGNWGRAGQFAGAVFGIPASPVVSTPEVASFADRVRATAQGRSTDVNRLVSQLEVALGHVGLDHTGNRYRTAKYASDLLSRILACADSSQMVDVLAAGVAPTSNQALGHSIEEAKSTADALSATNWALLTGAGNDVVQPLQAVLEADELAQSFAGTIPDLIREATAIVVQPRPAGEVTVRRVSSQSELDGVVTDIQEALEQGPLEVTWKRFGEQ